tara:strand:- start:20221 stop:21357 length:1137 start_codon:yes stop_codon:yes gene_type:complete
MTSPADSSDNLLEALNAEYQEGFAGKQRTSVDPNKLESMIARTREALQGEGVMTEALANGLKERLASFERELVLIHDAQSADGDSYRDFSALGREANLLFAQYDRHFAGKTRATRDSALLKEILAGLQDVHTRMNSLLKNDSSKAMKGDRDLVEERLTTYRQELVEIDKAFTSASAPQKSTYLADRANEQFKVYANLFANKNRMTRRLALMDRVISNLTSTHGAMKKLAGKGVEKKLNNSNMKIITERLAIYRSERKEIAKARKSATREELMNNLGGAANGVFEEYKTAFAGKARTTVDITQLEGMLDELEELRIQMREFAKSNPVEFNANNEKIVSDRMQQWLNEHRAIRQAQDGSAPQADKAQPPAASKPWEHAPS